MGPVDLFMESVQEAADGHPATVVHIHVLVVIEVAEILLGHESVEKCAKHTLPVCNRSAIEVVLRQQGHRKVKQRKGYRVPGLIIVRGDGHYECVQSPVLHRKIMV